MAMLCQNYITCPFFVTTAETLPEHEGTRMKEKYCFGDNKECARLRVAGKLGREHVPADMNPSDHKRAEQLLRNADAPDSPDNPAHS